MIHSFIRGDFRDMLLYELDEYDIDHVHPVCPMHIAIADLTCCYVVLITTRGGTCVILV